MLEVDDKQFEMIVAEAIESIPKKYLKHIKNVAFMVEDEPTPEQRLQLKLYPHESLFGLYEGLPLPLRQGTDKLLPDKITLFKKPLLSVSYSLKQVKENVRHTIWHEVAHYYGLDHPRIHSLERKPPKVK